MEEGFNTRLSNDVKFDSNIFKKYSNAVTIFGPATFKKVESVNSSRRAKTSEG